MQSKLCCPFIDLSSLVAFAFLAHSFRGVSTICYLQFTKYDESDSRKPLSSGSLLRNMVLTVHFTIDFISFLLASGAYTLEVNNNSQLISFYTVCAVQTTIQITSGKTHPHKLLYHLICDVNILRAFLFIMKVAYNDFN